MASVRACRDCHRQILQDLPACPVCGGELIEQERPRIDRIAFGQRVQQCRRCMYYGTRGGRAGCLMLKVPCQVDRLWVKPEADWCVMGMGSRCPD